ncbi:variable large family protein [Borrelia persica]|uniref:variable large family protein n=1 Tax=Borrelia persica TaxID=44448 RepID=UPI0004B924AC|nr:variable large family protein [Borrelia persica]
MREVMKRSLFIIMILGIMGCNNGVAELEKKNEFLQSLVSLGNDFIGVFTSFGDIVGSVLGFNLESKKSDVGKYFKKVQDTVQRVKDGLNKIVDDMKKEGNPNFASTETVVNKLVTETLDKIIDGAKIASEAIGDDNNPIGNISAAGSGGTVGVGVESLIKGSKSIVDVVLRDVGNAEAGDDKKAENLSARNNDGAGKLYANVADADAKKAAADAAKAVGAVTGADILQAISKGNEGDASRLAKHNAVAGAEANKKDAVIAGGIALRAMAKDGKFAGPNAADADAKKAIEGASVGAVTKVLDTLTIAIRNTVDVGLKTVKEAIKINANDTPVTFDKNTSEGK